MAALTSGAKACLKGRRRISISNSSSFGKITKMSPQTKDQDKQIAKNEHQRHVKRISHSGAFYWGIEVELSYVRAYVYIQVWAHCPFQIRLFFQTLSKICGGPGFYFVSQPLEKNENWFWQAKSRLEKNRYDNFYVSFLSSVSVLFGALLHALNIRTLYWVLYGYGFHSFVRSAGPFPIKVDCEQAKAKYSADPGLAV